MPWGGERRKFCKVCGRPREPHEMFSARGKCENCGNGRMLANSAQLAARKGPMFEHWYEQMRLRFEHARLPTDE